MTDVLDVIAGRRRWAILHADCREVLPLLPDKSVQHVITDPPYEAEAHTGGCRAKRTGVEARPLDFEPMTDGDRCVIGGHVTRIATRWSIIFCQLEASILWRDAIVAGGGTVRRIGVWVKPDAQPQFSGDRPGMGFETLVFAHPKGRSRWNGGGRVAVFEHVKHNGAEQKSGHMTQKPLPLMLELVELFTDPGEVVLDPFAGSGTTGVAALRLGRRCILIEKDEKYAALCRERMEAEEQGLSLKAARAGQLSLLST